MPPVMIEDILSAHADALNQGVDHTEWLRERYAHTAVDSTQKQHLEELLQLARLLKRALVLQPARPEFATQLRMDLDHPTATPPVPEPPRWLMGIAFLFSLVAGWLGWRYWRRTATEKPTPSHPSHPTPSFK